MVMIDFKSVTPADREVLTSYIFPGERRDSNLSFASICCWQFLNCSSFAVIEGQLVLRFCFPEDKTVYTLPAGEKAVQKVIPILARQAKQEDLPLYLYGIVPDMYKELEEIFPDVFEYRTERDHFDYLYLKKDLAALSGKDYQTKRNHANKFRKTYSFCYTPMTAEMVPDCLEMYDLWCNDRRCDEDESLEYERQALKYGLAHFNELNLTGGVLRVDGKIIAFTFGAPVNRDTFCVHAEKALAAYDGGYNVINQEFACHLPECYIYLNREEDLGLEGLRKAKLSYRPVLLLEKGLAICGQGTWDSLII